MTADPRAGRWKVWMLLIPRTVVLGALLGLCCGAAVVVECAAPQPSSIYAVGYEEDRFQSIFKRSAQICAVTGEQTVED
jgi:hypothetical protein